MKEEHKTNTMPGQWSSETRDRLAQAVRDVLGNAPYLLISSTEDWIGMMGNVSKEHAVEILERAEASLFIDIYGKFQI